MAQARTKIAISQRKSPRQARSSFTVQAILDAATRVLEKGSLANFNTNKVAEIAGVSVGSLYQYFPNKDALMAQLILREQEGLVLAIETAMADKKIRTLHQCLVRLVKVAMAHQWRNPVFAAALDHEEQRLPLQTELRTFQLRIVQSIAKRLKLHCPGHTYIKYLQTTKECVVICKAIVDSQEHPSKVFEVRLVEILQAIVNLRLNRRMKPSNQV